MNVETIKRNFDRGLWTVAMVGKAARKGVITPEQYSAITSAPDSDLYDTPEKEKEKALSQLSARRKQAEYAGFTLNGQHWDSETKDELRLNSIFKMMDDLQMDEFPGWKINADTFIVLTREILAQASVAMMQHYAACFAVEAAKVAELEALATAEGATVADIKAWVSGPMHEGWPG